MGRIMNEMVERVARAIQQLEGCYDGCNHCKKGAIAAIKAMREPTEEMIALGMQHGIEIGSSEMVWYAMIDAALKDD